MKNASLYSIALGALLLSACVAPSTLQAQEINFGTLKEQRADRLLLEYKGPSGTNYFSCTLEGKCSNRGTTTPKFVHTLLGSTDYTRSNDGALAVRAFPLSTATYHILYDVSGSKAKRLAIIPYMTSGARIYITKDNSAVIFRSGNTLTRYTISTKKTEALTLAQDLAFFSISPKGTYVTGYNYGTQLHELWRFSDGRMQNGPSAMQSYLEFSEDETRVAYLEDVDGFRTLYTMQTRDLGTANPPLAKALTKPKSETEDYLFVGTTLYFMANVEGPLEWDLFAYDGRATTLVDTDVSYGDFLKRVPGSKKSYLAYLKNMGKNSNVILVEPGVEKKTVLSPMKASPLSSAVNREVKTYGGTTGVLLSPKKPAKSPALFIWMHGGPQRQVAKEFHPYLSYAVYDELLERLVAGGHYVYKIDYSGSTGYGAEFKKALHMKIGDVEMQDVTRAVSAIKKDVKVGNVHLIGNSYGGYMAFRGIVKAPKTFTGAVSINGVSDWYGLIDRIPSSPFKTLFEGVPDTHNMQAYLQASVFTGMEKLTKDNKVVVVWGERDSTVPVWQSTNYIEFAKTRNVSLDTLSFPDEDHIIRKRENLDALCKKVVTSLKVDGVSCSL